MSQRRVSAHAKQGHREVAGSPGRLALRRKPIATAVSAILAGIPAAYAQQVAQGPADTGGGLAEIIVTAQKVAENVQSVPISIQVMNNEKLEQLSIQNLDDYVKHVPSVAYVRGQGQGGNGQPGDSHVYMRGVVSGGDGNHSGSQPSVGTYLDEQPVTTIDGTVDVHVYDIDRIEVLEGPQGTLYGASSEAGTIRIITNKPDPSAFKAGYDATVNSVDHGGIGYSGEGFVNMPISSIAAVRLVGWYERDAGYIDNVAGTNQSACIVNGIRTFPSWSGQNTSTCPTVGVVGAGAITNAPWRKNDYNTAITKGGRAALKLLLGDNWTITPTVMGQWVDTEGFFGYDPGVGDLKITHFGPENADDSWVQTALTIEGKLSNFDLVYAGAFMKRTRHSIADYSDYSEFYDRLYGSGAFWTGNNGKPIMPQEIVNGIDYFQKWSHELRLTTPQDLPVKGTVGVFIQRQLHNIWQLYSMPGYGFTDPTGHTENPNGFADSLAIPGYPNTIWLTDEQRVDRDRAVFAQVTWDITSQLSVNGGIRYFKYDNSLGGFFGYSSGFSSSTGQANCFGPASTAGAPCTNLNQTVADTGNVPRLNVTYKFDADHMIYATYSKGFRPGGVNRVSQAGIGPYKADFLKNYEIGWKTQWFDRRLRWNGAFFWEDWKDFQFSFLGPHSLTIIENGGNARIKGVESEIEWAPTNALTFSANFTLLDPVLTQNYCGENDANGAPATSNPCPAYPGSLRGEPYSPLAPAGTNLPVSPKFKGSLVGRYGFAPIEGWLPYAQASVTYQSQVAPALEPQNVAVIGMQPSYALVDLSGGFEKNGLSIRLLVNNIMDRRAQLSRFVQCTVNNNAGTPVCAQPYIIPAQPRTISLQFGQKF